MAFGKAFPLNLASAYGTIYLQIFTQRAQRRRARRGKKEEEFTTEGNSELHGGHGVKKNLLYFFPIHASTL